jgi:uncharacterized protein involved in exopolysaccharide biosynthesis
MQPKDETGRQGILVMMDESTQSLSLFDTMVGRVVRTYWPLIVGLGLVCAVATYAYCFFSPKWYRAQAMLAPAPQESGAALNALSGQIGGLAALAGIDIDGGEGFKEEALARLSSREFTFAFINDLNLLPVLFADDWNAKTKSWRDPDEVPTMERAYKFFNDEVRTVSEDRRNGLVKITVDWTDPDLAMSWANELVTRINADRRAVARADAQRNLDYLNRELAQTNVVEVRQLLNRLVESETRKAMLASVREQYAFKVIDPAFRPGRQNIVRPRAVVLSAVALVGGGTLGMLLALVLFVRKGRKVE